jgi:cyclase
MKMKKYLIAIFCYLLCLEGYAQHHNSLEKVSDRLFMIKGNGGNVTFLTTEEGVLVVDAGALEIDGKKIVDLVKSVTDKEIKYLILTHYHYDHTLGACGFPENTTIIGHENIVNNIKAYGQEHLDKYKNKDLGPKVDYLKSKVDSLKQIKDPDLKEYENRYLSHSKQLVNLDSTFIVYPEITFQDKMTFFLGEDTINLIYPHNAHTDDNILVEFQNHKTLTTGDFFFNRCLPFIDYKTNCDTKNWITQIEKYSTLAYKYVIPGHGEIGSAKDMIRQAEYLRDLRETITLSIKKNKTLEEILQEVEMKKYADWDYQFLLSSGIEAVYNELTESKEN